MVYFDFLKAFDQADHAILAVKIAELSMPYLLFETTISFITNSTYVLKVDGISRENVFTATSSVPQGSHCGPLLYLLMCRDIVKCIDNTGVRMLQYADETKFFKILNNEHDRQSMQKAIENFSKWSATNKLKLNCAKTFHVTFSRKIHAKFHLTILPGNGKNLKANGNHGPGHII